MEPPRATDYNLSAQRWYAQHLADAIYRTKWTPLRFPVDGEAPNFRTLGAGQLPSAKILHTTSRAIEKAGIPACHIKIGRTEYQRVLAALNQEERWYWLWHVEPNAFDRDGNFVPRPAIFHASGARVEAAPCHPALRSAALTVVSVAVVEPLRLQGA